MKAISHKRPVVKCPKCGKEVSAKGLTTHYEMVHKKADQKALRKMKEDK